MTSIFSKEQFLQFQTAFKARAINRLNDEGDMMLYNIMRGKDTQCGFSPITNTVKLANGTQAWGSYKMAKNIVVARVMKGWYNPKITDPTYLKNTYGIEASEEQLKAIAAAAGWVLK